MARLPTLPVILGFTIFFTLLFHNKPLGINLLIFESGVLVYLFFNNYLPFSTPKLKLLLTVQLATCLVTIITYSAFAYLVHFLLSIVFVGVVIFPAVKSLLNSLFLSISSLFISQLTFFRVALQARIGNKSPAAILWEFRLFAIPSVVIFLFISIYNYSNPKFNAITADIGSGIFSIINKLVSHYDLTVLGTILLGLFISNYVLFRTPKSEVIENDTRSNDILTNPHNLQSEGKNLILIKNEMRSAIFLLVVLNAILLIVNIIDINWVWFNFEWEGQYLRQFVHEGTWLLIISILLSITIVLYFFRGPINFEENKFLKYLCYIWLFQNTILAVSVTIRNIYYIEYFNLAYKRIGVLIFLVLTVYGLFSVLMKVSRKYSAFYLFRTNFNALLVVLTLSALVNWDTFIAKYNFDHSNSAFVHFNFLAGLSQKSLPVLDKSLSELKKIEIAQKKKFPNETFYMTPEFYHSLIQKRKERFRENWETKGWLSWNLPEQLAYNQLFSKQKE